MVKECEINTHDWELNDSNPAIWFNMVGAGGNCNKSHKPSIDKTHAV